jgi:hypothetical protein
VELTVYPAAAPAAALVLAHGAGAGQSSPFMTRIGRGLAARAVSTATFDFPYLRAGRKLPDPPHVLENSWREAMEEARVQLHSPRIVIGGKSMGGRIASQVAAQGAAGIDGLVFLGYPLHPPGKPQQRRDAHLPRIVEPMLFVQGARDAFGTADEIRQLLTSLQHATLHEVPGGDHSFKVPARGAPKPDEVMQAVIDAVAEWIVRSVSARSAG